jgi:hypothetical protein
MKHFNLLFCQTFIASLSFHDLINHKLPGPTFVESGSQVDFEQRSIPCYVDKLGLILDLSEK